MDPSATSPSDTVRVGVRLFREGAKLPTKGTDFAAGFDVYAWEMYRDQPSLAIVGAHQMTTILTGLNLRIPVGYEIQVRPRSGLAAKHQITVMNSPGTIDADYDGDGEAFELKIMLVNHGDKDFEVHHGDRVAQLVVKPVPKVELFEVYGDNQARHTSNRDGGLGSTGKQ
jgi:dUTP pyrophosphatase